MPELFDITDFQYDSKGQTVEAGWSNVAETYPITVDSPSSAQPQVRIQHTPASGVYIVGLSSTYEINSVGNSAQVRFSLDGGLFWEDFSRESKDTTDRLTMDYTFPLETDGSPLDIVVQMKKENVTNTMQVHFLNLWIERKS